jgi:hypothetical protein
LIGSFGFLAEIRKSLFKKNAVPHKKGKAESKKFNGVTRIAMELLQNGTTLQLMSGSYLFVESNTTLLEGYPLYVLFIELQERSYIKRVRMHRIFHLELIFLPSA